MIDIVKQTPAEYSKQSRDYQVIARLFTTMFNYSKMYVDNLNTWMPNIDNKLSILRAKTLNFDIRHTWDLDELEAVTSCFKYLIRNKGTKIALNYCVSILLRILNLNSKVADVQIDPATLSITIWADVNSISSGVIEDLIAHLLPAGWGYRLVQYSEVSPTNGNINTEIFYDKDNIKTKPIENSYSLFIGNDNPKKRFITKTFVYDDTEGKDTLLTKGDPNEPDKE